MRIAIIGAGAAGCFAAANIPSAQGQEVLVFEKTGKALQKVKVSGGGRCNVTHACFDVKELLEKYPRGRALLRHTLHQFSPQDTIKWFKERGLELKTEADGRMFPVSNSSQSVIDCLWQTMMKNGVKVLFNKAVRSIEKKEKGFDIHFAEGDSYDADKIIIATGGFPKAAQYEWLTSLGHKIQTPVPSLFTFNIPGNPITELMGLSVPNATIKIQGTKIKSSGPLLITHWGFSGPLVLRTSAWAARELQEMNYHFKVAVNWLGNITEAELRDNFSQLRRENGKQPLLSSNEFALPKRLWAHLLNKSGITDTIRWGELQSVSQNKLVQHLLLDEYEVKGKTTFKEEFVTCGGISLPEIDPHTMESKIVPGLYFAGEILDVDGVTGGFNFQHAWSSGWVVSQSLTSSTSLNAFPRILKA